MGSPRRRYESSPLSVKKSRAVYKNKVMMKQQQSDDNDENNEFTDIRLDGDLMLMMDDEDDNSIAYDDNFVTAVAAARATAFNSDRMSEVFLEKQQRKEQQQQGVRAERNQESVRDDDSSPSSSIPQKFLPLLEKILPKNYKLEQLQGDVDKVLGKFFCGAVCFAPSSVRKYHFDEDDDGTVSDLLLQPEPVRVVH